MGIKDKAKPKIKLAIQNQDVEIKDCCHRCGYLNPEGGRVYKCHVHGACPALPAFRDTPELTQPLSKVKVPKSEVVWMPVAEAKLVRGKVYQIFAPGTMFGPICSAKHDPEYLGGFKIEVAGGEVSLSGATHVALIGTP